MTYQEFQKEIEPHIGQLVLHFYDVVLLLGASEDQWDYYYVLVHEGGKEVHATVVSSYYPLKGVLPDKQYNELVRVWNLNHVEKYHAK